MLQLSSSFDLYSSSWSLSWHMYIYPSVTPALILDDLFVTYSIVAYWWPSCSVLFSNWKFRLLLFLILSFNSFFNSMFLPETALWLSGILIVKFLVLYLNYKTFGASSSFTGLIYLSLKEDELSSSWLSTTFLLVIPGIFDKISDYLNI